MPPILPAAVPGRPCWGAAGHAGKGRAAHARRRRPEVAAGPSLPFLSLLFPFPRLINVGIHLLQDEEREVRHEASGFASLLQLDPGESLPDNCIFVQDNVGLLGLLQLLLAEFGEHPETFDSLLQHLPILDLRGIVEELETNK